MTYNKFFGILIFSLFCVLHSSSYGAGLVANKHKTQVNSTSAKDSLNWSVSFVKKIFNGSGEWYMTNDSFQKSIRGVVDYTENEPIDTVVVNLNRLLKSDTIPAIFNRKAENIPNKKSVPGFIASDDLERLVEARRKFVTDSIRGNLVVVPDTWLAEGLSKAPLIQLGDPRQMMAGMDKNLPAAFTNRFNKGWANIVLPANVTSAEIDTLKSRLFKDTRQSYNDSVLFVKRDSLLQAYRENYILQLSADAASKKRNQLGVRNREILNAFNESEIRKVNDSIRTALRFLTDRAAADSSLITVSNLTGARSKIWTANQPMIPMRIYLKNEQNDSLSVVLYNNGKGELKMVIDDGVKFQHFTESQKKEITFHPKKPDPNLRKVNLRQIDPLPWKLFGIGTVGFTQTSLTNWAKGGESSMSLLLIEKYTVNYSKKNFKWENLAEFRLGIFSSQSKGLEKNDDKIEIQSRAGLSAFKKWYYSLETDFRTQMAKGYMYPDKSKPISAFMAPGYLTFSLGMDYKPNKNFSLFLSPLTSKSTFVKDTVLVNPTNFGLEKGKKSLWEPGAIVKVNWHYPIMENIVYDTRAEVFNNYRYTFQKFNVDWEQSLVLQVTQHINSRIMTQLIYDYNVKFPITDASGVQIAQQAKWQFKELLTIGFNYKF